MKLKLHRKPEQGGVSLVSIFNLTPLQIVVIGAIIGIAFALPLTTDEDGVFGNVLGVAGEMIFIIGLQRVLITNARTAAQAAAPAAQATASSAASTETMQRQIDELTEKIMKRAAILKRNALS
jgi:hypothetical protein